MLSSSRKRTNPGHPPVSEQSAIDIRKLAGIPRAVAEVTLHENRPAGASLGSTSHDGRYLWLRPARGFKVAGDIEAIDNPSAHRMADRLGIDPGVFLRFWTMLETIAKLESVPVDTLFRQHRASPHAAVLEAAYPDTCFVTLIQNGYVLTVGWIRSVAGDRLAETEEPTR